MRYYLYNSNFPLPDGNPNLFELRPIETISEETLIFPEASSECYPLLPENLLLPFCQQSEKRPAIIIQSVDYSLGETPRFLSEQEALQLAQRYQVKLYHDEVSNSSYYCYMDSSCQHIVWLEDGFHLLQKIKKLQKYDVSELGLIVNQHNFQTISRFIQMVS